MCAQGGLGEGPVDLLRSQPWLLSHPGAGPVEVSLQLFFKEGLSHQRQEEKVPRTGTHRNWLSVGLPGLQASCWLELRASTHYRVDVDGACFSYGFHC